MMVGRGAKKKGIRYFGPYSHAWAIRETVDLLLRVLPDAVVQQRRLQAVAADRAALPARLHRQVLRAVRRLGSAAEEHREIVDDFCDFMAGQTAAFVKRIEKEMYAAVRGAGLREGRPAPRRPRRAEEGAGEAGGRARRRHRRRRDRARRGPARGRGADLLRPRRPDPRPARLGRRPGRRRRHRRAGRATSCSSCTPATPATRSRARSWCPPQPPDAGDLRAAALRPAGEQGLDPGAAARRQEVAAGDRRPQRQAGAGPAQDQAGQRPDHPQPGAGGDPGGARPSRRCRCGSSATTSPTSRAPRSSPRWWSSRTAWPARASTAGS